MKNPKLINQQSIAAAGKSSLKLRKRQRALYAFLAMIAIVVLAGCVGHGYYGGSYGYRGPSYSSGYYIGGVHRPYYYGTQHSIGRSGFGRGGGRGR